MERGHNMLYACYDNNAYMNTGIQRSSATPVGAHTSTAPSGSHSTGKHEIREGLTRLDEEARSLQASVQAGQRARSGVHAGFCGQGMGEIVEVGGEHVVKVGLF